MLLSHTHTNLGAVSPPISVSEARSVTSPHTVTFCRQQVRRVTTWLSRSAVNGGPSAVRLHVTSSARTVMDSAWVESDPGIPADQHCGQLNDPQPVQEFNDDRDGLYDRRVTTERRQAWWHRSPDGPDAELNSWVCRPVWRVLGPCPDRRYGRRRLGGRRSWAVNAQMHTWPGREVAPHRGRYQLVTVAMSEDERGLRRRRRLVLRSTISNGRKQNTCHNNSTNHINNFLHAQHVFLDRLLVALKRAGCVGL